MYLFVNVLRRVHGFMAHHGQVQTWSARRRDRNDTGFAPWRVRPHRVRPHYKISISSSPPTFSARVYVVVIELQNVFEEPFQSIYV